MAVRAKFTVTEVAQISHQPAARRIKLAAQYDVTIPEDRRFCEYTPSGTLEMYVTNPAAIEALPLGQAFYLDFTPVD